LGSKPNEILRLLILAGSGFCATFCFWPYPTGFLAFLIFVPLLMLGGFDEEGRAYLRRSFVFGLAYFVGSLYWIALLERDQISVPWLRLPAMVVLCLYLSLFVLAAGWFTRRLRRAGLPLELAFPLAWAGCEYLRSLGPLGFTWAGIGYSQAGNPPAMQQAAVVGTFGVSLWVTLVAAMIAGALLRRSRKVAVAACLILAGPVLLGYLVLGRARTEPGPRLALVQPNISGAVKWDQAFRDSSMSALRRLTLDATGASMVVWPETAVPYHIRYSRDLEDLVELARTRRSALLFGFPDYVMTDGDIRFYNSAMLISAGGEIAGEYRKIHLVPFGEMIPFEDRIEVLRRIELGQADFSPGRDHTVFDLDGTAFAVAICFESIYPSLVGEFVEEGARVLVNITNDEWFGPSIGPSQHAQMALMRAVEFRVGLARCANTGISLFADPYGRITSRTELFRRRILQDRVVPGSGSTPYRVIGPFLERGMLLACLALAVLGYARRSSRGKV
jgi:apolipoprotein N-acyltransferase